MFDTNNGSYYFRSMVDRTPDDMLKIYEHAKQFQDKESQSKVKIVKLAVDEIQHSLAREIAQASRCDEARKLAETESDK